MTAQPIEATAEISIDPGLLTALIERALHLSTPEGCHMNCPVCWAEALLTPEVEEELPPFTVLTDTTGGDPMRFVYDYDKLPADETPVGPQGVLFAVAADDTPPGQAPAQNETAGEPTGEESQ
ncbi:hypothetical protein AB0395_35190 [Streptosporangium sp. NPDC051023]|uniref:hypothetical protein n=1 Tax=Streptosporangium sp. NPDC051023 TaxID=3155410 RepID=UPI00344F79FF